MSDITPEMLKVIAEGMGYTILGCSSFYPTVKRGEYSKVLAYNPPTYAEQDRELEIKLKFHTWWHQGFWEASPNETTSKPIFGIGKTPVEARCITAYKYFNHIKQQTE